MIIAIEDGLGEIKKRLEESGHLVVPLYGHIGSVDVIVYKEAEMQQIFSAENYIAESQGILMICVGRMSPEEVLQAVENRSYGTIF